MRDCISDSEAQGNVVLQTIKLLALRSSPVRIAFESFSSILVVIVSLHEFDYFRLSQTDVTDVIANCMPVTQHQCLFASLKKLPEKFEFMVSKIVRHDSFICLIGCTVRKVWHGVHESDLEVCQRELLLHQVHESFHMLLYLYALLDDQDDVQHLACIPHVFA